MANQDQVIELSNLKVSCHACTLAELCLPRGLDETEIERLDGIVERHRPLPRGEHLFRMGDSFRSLYAMRSGSIKTYTSTEDGNEQILGFHLPGELLGLDGLEKESHACAAVALESAAVCELPFTRLEELCRILPGLQRQMMRLIGKEVVTEHAMLLLLGKKNAEERLASLLLSLSARFKQRGFSEREFNLSMSRQDIANYLGLTVETVSRLFTRFQGDDLLSVQRRHIRIQDMDRLRSMAGICAS